MAIKPQDGPSHASSRAPAQERSVGEHIFIWIAWALAAAFWGASLTTMVEIFRAVAQPVSQAGATGMPAGSAYLVLVVAAFLVMAVALAYAEIRAARGAGGRGEAATAALYNAAERQDGEDQTAGRSRRAHADREIR